MKINHQTGVVWRVGRVWGLALGLAWAASPAGAATFTWDGGGGDNNWSTAANWDTTTPDNNGTADLIFTGTTRVTPNVDSPWSLQSVTFDDSVTADSFTIGGNEMTFAAGGSVTNDSLSTHTINADLIADTTQTFDSNAGNLSIGGGVDLSTGAAVLTVGGAQDTTISGVISGAGGSVVKNDGGTLTLSGANAFDGPVTLNAGTLAVGNNAALGNSLVINGGSLEASGGSRVIPDSVAVTLATDLSMTGALGLEIASDLDLTDNRTFSTSNATEISGVISESGGVRALTKAGSGSLELSALNTYTGDTTVSGGSLIITGSVMGDVDVASGATLTVGSDAAIRSGQTLTLNSGSTLQATGGKRTIPAGVALDVVGDFSIAGSDDLEIVSGIALAADRTITVTNTADTEISGEISGANGLTKAGTGSLELSATNTYTGDTMINGGTLIVSGSVMDDVVINSGGTLAIGNDGAVQPGKTLTLNGGALQAHGGARTVSTPVTVGGDFAVSGSEDLEIASGFTLGADRTITVTNTGVTQISGEISGANGLTKAGTGSLELSHDNLYTGNTVVDAGTLLLSGSVDGGVLVTGGLLDLSGEVAGNATVTGGMLLVNGGAITGGTTTVDSGGTLALGSDLAGAVTINDGASLQASGGDRTLTAAVALNGDFTVSGTHGLEVTSDLALGANRTVTVTNAATTAKLSGVISDGGGVLALTKEGLGSLELSAINTYTGSTTVNAGNLILSSGSVMGDANVNSGGTLTLSGGAVGGDTNIHNGGTLALGSDLTTGHVILNNGASLQAVGVAGAPRLLGSAITVNGDFTVSGTDDLEIANNMTLNANQVLTVTNTGSTEILGVISESGAGRSLTKEGAGSLTLSGVNTYTGDTVVNQGTLTIADSGSVAGDVVVSGGTLDVAEMGTVGGVATVTSGAMNLGGTVTDATVDGGTLSISATGQVTGNATVNGGVLNLSGTVANNATVTGGALLVGDGADIMGTTTVDTGGTLALGSDMFSLTNVTLNSGAGLQASGGARTLAASAITLGGDFAVSGSEDLTITGPIGLTSDRTITVTNTGDTVIDGVISGAHALTKDGAQTLELSGANTYTGDTNIDGGTLILSGSVVNNVVVNDGGALAIGNDGAVQSGKTITLNNGGALLASGGARTVASDINVVVGGDFTVSGSNDLQIASDIALGADRTITVSNLGGTVVSGVLSGAGGLTKAGNSVLELSGVNTYTGNTVVSAGTLLVSGSLASATATVNAGALLAGSGTINGNVAVVGSGFLNAGAINEAGTMTINGDLALNNSSTLLVDLASVTQGDLYDVSGSAAVDGTLRVAVLSGYVPGNGNQFTVIEADGGVTGAFDSVLDTIPGLAFEIFDDGDPNTVVIAIDDVPYVLTASSSNQISVAAVLDTLRPTATGDLATVFNEMNMLNAGQLQAALDQVVPEELGALSNMSFGLSNIQATNVSHRMSEVRLVGHGGGHSTRHLQLASAGNTPHQDLMLMALANNDPYPYWPPSTESYGFSKDQPWSFFASGAATLGEIDDTASHSGYDFTTTGITLGMDRRFHRHLVAGLMLGYGKSDIDIDNNGGEVDVNSARVGVYGTYYLDGFYINGMIGGAFHGYDVDRHVQFGGINRTATASPDGLEFNAMIEFGVDMDWQQYQIGPVVSIRYSDLTIDDYTESGAGALNLSVEEQGVDSLVVQVGMRASTEMVVGKTLLIPSFRALYQNDSDDQERSITARFAGGSGGAFSFNTADIGQDSAILGAGVTIVSDTNWTAFFDINSELGRKDYIVYGVRGGLQISF